MDNIGSKSISLTIDVEPDFGGLLKSDRYYGKDHLLKLMDLINKFDLHITAFVTGKTMEDNPEIIDLLKAMNTEIEQHSFSHQVHHKSKIDDISKGIQVYKNIMNKTPTGYRAPQGIITKPEALYLEDMGIKYDSSIFPSFFPGRYNRLKFPTEPFMISDTNLMEIPFAVIPTVRIPIALSYMQLLGLKTFKSLFKIFGIPSLLVYDFHSYELGKVQSYHELPFITKLGYYRSQRMYNDPFLVLKEFIEYILSNGYKSVYMSTIYKDSYNNVPKWDWDSLH